MNSALASLTETYTDSENEDNHEDPERSDPEEKQTKAIVHQPKKKSSKFPRRLVSYNDNEMHEEASDDEQNPSEEVEETKEETENNEDKYSKYVKKYGFDLPAEPKTKQDPKLQETITNIYQKIKISDFDLNQYIQAEKKFRNPSIYDKLIQFLEIDELGTNFPPEIYDVSIYGPESYYEELAKAQKLEMDKLEKMKKELGNVKAEVIKEMSSTKRKSKWDQQAPSSAASSVTTSTTGKTTVISAFGTLKKPKI